MSIKRLYFIFLIGIVALIFFWLIQNRKVSKTSRQISRFGMSFAIHAYSEGKIYEKSLNEAYDAMIKTGLYGKGHGIHTWDLIKTGRDAWGRPLIYDLREDGFFLSLRVLVRKSSGIFLTVSV